MPKASTKANTSVFGAAPTIAVSASPSKSKAPIIEIEGIQDIASLDAVIAALEAVREVRKNAVKEKTGEYFITKGLEIRKKPENIRGIEGFGSASCQLRASSSSLSDITIALCNEHGIEIATEEKVADTFIFATAYAADPAFVTKLEALLGPKLMELQDARGPIILKQDGVSKSKITDVGRDAIFTKTEAVVREFLPLAFTLSVGAKMETGGDIKPALKLVEEILGSSLWQDVAKEAATNPSALDKKTKAKAKTTKEAA